MGERTDFIAAFGVLYPVSDTMVQKCWSAMEKVPHPHREALARAMLEAACAVAVASEAAKSAITNSIGVTHSNPARMKR